jgi:hypothetical protein
MKNRTGATERRLATIVMVAALAFAAAAAPFAPVPAFLDYVDSRGVAVDRTDSLALRVVAEFGAIFVVRGEPVVPQVWMFENEPHVASWQSGLRRASMRTGAEDIELQAAALAAFERARTAAHAEGLAITPAGVMAARRSYATTVDLWLSRVRPALDHWVAKQKLSSEDAMRILALDPKRQIPEILRLEAKGLYCAKSLDKSILYSVAAPGTSQHLSMLALDIVEHDQPRVRQILGDQGWFQTVYSDLPHFTFIGAPEKDLPALGLVPRRNSGRVFWLVNVGKSRGGPLVTREPSEVCAF